MSRLLAAVIASLMVSGLNVAAADPLPKASTRQSLALISITRGEGFSQSEVNTLQELLLSSLDATGRFKVIGQSDIDAILNLEAKKESVGCTDSGCMVQIAGALGADLVASADIGKLGDNTLLTLKVIAVRTATVAARAQETVQSANDLPRAAHALAEAIVAGLDGRAVVAQTATSPEPVPRRRSVPAEITGYVFMGVALAAAGVAVDLGLQARADQSSLHTTPRPGAEAQKLMQTSNTDALATDILIGGAVAFGVTGIGVRAAF